MNVLIIEMGGSHIECVYSMMHFLHLKKANVHVACNIKLVPYLTEQNKLNGLLQLENDFTRSQQVSGFFKIRKYIRTNNIDTVVINTTEIKIIRNLSFFLPKTINGIGIVHNARKLEKSFTFTKILSRRIKKFFVLGDYLLSKIQPDPVFKVDSFYPVYFPAVKKFINSKPVNEYWIIVPGEADGSRRDYVALLDQLKNTPALSVDIRFVFLGKYKLNEVIDEKNKWGENIIFFNDYIDYDTFHSYIQQADIILPLLKIVNNDFYGNSRISGSFNLGLGYHIPFLLPDTYKENEDLQPFSLYYEDMQQLIEKVQRLAINDTEERNRIMDAYKNSRFNDIDAMADKVYDFIIS